MINAGELFVGGLQATGPATAKAPTGGGREGGAFEDLLRQAMDEPAEEKAPVRPEAAPKGGEAEDESAAADEDGAGRPEKADRVQKKETAGEEDGDAGATMNQAAATESAEAAGASLAEWVGAGQAQEPEVDQDAASEDGIENLQFSLQTPQDGEGAPGGEEQENPEGQDPAAEFGLAEGGEPAPTAFDLLDATEAVDPSLRVEATPGRLLERLQQSVGTAAGAAVAEEAAEVVLPQVVRSVATLVRDGLAEMRLQLQPGDLGHIEVRVKATEGVVRAELMVQQGEVKQLLESQAEKLRAALSQQGLELEGFDVDLSGGRGNGGQAAEAWERTSGLNRGANPSNAGGETAGTAAAPALAPVVGGGTEVDYLA